jgi:Cation efflux family
LRHIFADLLGSVGVIAAALVILLTDWLYADPIISVLIGFLVLGISCKLLRDSTNILQEQAPRGIDANEVGRKSEGGTLGSRCAGMLSHGEVAEWTWARGSQIWTSRCYGCGCWVLILLDSPRCAGLTQPCP